MSAKGHRYPWSSVIEDIAMDLADRVPTAEEFARLWGLLGEVVRYLSTHDERSKPSHAEVAYQSIVGRPRIVCLCGSTRFYDAFQQANYDLTMAGNIVLSVGFYPHAEGEKVRHGEGVGHDSAEKVALDELHLRKIDLADEVFVLNVGGYVGESTAREIAYAVTAGKPVRYLEHVSAPSHLWASSTETTPPLSDGVDEGRLS